MTSSDRKAAQQAEAQRQQVSDPLRAELNEAAVAAGIRTGSMWLRPDNLRIGPGPDRPVAERN